MIAKILPPADFLKMKKFLKYEVFFLSPSAVSSLGHYRKIQQIGSKNASANKEAPTFLISFIFSSASQVETQGRHHADL
jgi:hypothetical protein